jgi:hypothetical protein
MAGDGTGTLSAFSRQSFSSSVMNGFAEAGIGMPRQAEL